MLDGLEATCDRCDDPLRPDNLLLAMRTDAGSRRPYECDCGAVTITVVAEP